ncbi:MAG: aminotransferase class V-fold PLP-dependent enzyme, partial [Gammaproteobacteria bacterium]|nr:aminotransferase class V-fold PLP-dependent enzyme [Gammaproteobacteria bacterium]
MSALTSLRAAAKPAVADFDPLHWRRDFPILGQKVHGKPLIYLDNAATAQKPQSVIDAVAQFYSQSNSNVHRGVHALSERATAQYEAARAKVRDFLHA